jgi:hypothetical protein
MEIAYIYPSQNPRLDAAVRPPEDVPDVETALFGEDGLSFKDIFDVVNPLQQLPVVSSLYRSATGDTISAISRLAGGALLGGPVGLLASAINVGIEALSGNDIGEHLLAMFGDSEKEYANAAGAYQKASKLPG